MCLATEDRAASFEKPCDSSMSRNITRLFLDDTFLTLALSIPEYCPTYNMIE